MNIFVYNRFNKIGKIKGLADAKQSCLDIENKINDSISPQPNYTLEIQNNDQTIKLTDKKWTSKAVIYTNQKAYKRNDTATIEVDTLDFKTYFRRTKYQI